MAGRKIDKSPTRVSLHDLRDVKISASGEPGMTVEFTVPQSDDATIRDMLYAVLTHYGINRHEELVSEMIRTPGTFDKIQGAREAQKIMAR